MTQTSLMMVSGTDDHLRRKFIRQVQKGYRSRGWQVVSMDGEDHAYLESLLNSNGVLFDQQTFVVVTNPEKLPLAVVKDHAKDTSPSVVLFLVYTGDKPTGKVSELVPPEGTKPPINLPSFFKMEEYAVKYAKEEARAGGYPMDHGLATSLVLHVGTDLGLLGFEVAKACVLARARNHQGLLTPAIVKDTLAPLSEIDGSAIVTALGTRNRTSLVAELHRYRVSKGGDPTIELCGKTLSPTVLKWVQAAHLHESGVSPDAAAGRVSASPWYWKNIILPPARAWGFQGCRNLLRVIAKAQTAVFSGSVHPWVVLESGLLLAFGG